MHLRTAPLTLLSAQRVFPDHNKEHIRKNLSQDVVVAGRRRTEVLLSRDARDRSRSVQLDEDRDPIWHEDRTGSRAHAC